jgi:hypothetical protein
VTGPVVVDVAGGPMGGAARYRAEVYRYLDRIGRDDVMVIGDDRQVSPAWLVRREATRGGGTRRVALNNVSFVGAGAERWTLVANPWDFMTAEEASRLAPSARATIRRRAAVVRLAARRSDVIVAPCTDMAERIGRAIPSLRGRVVVRMHPVSADSVQAAPRQPVILCPVLFSPYKRMASRVGDWLSATREHISPNVRLLVTANRSEVPQEIADDRRVELVGRLEHSELCRLWALSQAIYFPTSTESFGYPLAEARVNGQAVIALDTPQNREIAGSALCPFRPDDPESLRLATQQALSADVAPDPGPFDPDAYFNWLLGASA